MIITPFAQQRKSADPAAWLSRLFTERADDYLHARWIFLRSLGLIFLSAFYSLWRQAHGLIGERGILPASIYLGDAGAVLHGPGRFWSLPTVFWAGASDRAITIALIAGILCSAMLVLNVVPRAMVVVCTILFLSFVTTLQDFSSYQSDGMLLEAGFISVFFAPGGVRPGLGTHDPPSRLSLFMLRWEWFRIYFESGLVKLMSGDVHWRNFTAMDEYYQNGPLPAWPGWYVQHLPHAYHAFTVAVTLVIELFVVWAVFLPRPFRLACCAAVTPLQLGIIATANYAFLNYLVLMEGVLLLDDRAVHWIRRRLRRAHPPASVPRQVPSRAWRGRVYVEGFFLTWVFYATLTALLAPGDAGLLGAPERALEPFRIANSYGLFANMTPARYEVEFQGSNDGGQTWTPYPFRYKPQDVHERPGIYAPFQPRFDWNLWFASLGPWRASPWVVGAQVRLLEGSPAVLSLFRRDPFKGHPPAAVRTVLWQYWFTDAATKRATGAWWRRQELGQFAGTVSHDSAGRVLFSEAQGAQ